MYYRKAFVFNTLSSSWSQTTNRCDSCQHHHYCHHRKTSATTRHRGLYVRHCSTETDDEQYPHSCALSQLKALSGHELNWSGTQHALGGWTLDRKFQSKCLNGWWQTYVQFKTLTQKCEDNIKTGHKRRGILRADERLPLLEQVRVVWVNLIWRKRSWSIWRSDTKAHQNWERTT